MCGVLGLVCATETEAAAAGQAVRSALRCQLHRGPDESDTWSDKEVVFGFNRLGFIDLERSHQPLTWGPAGSEDRYTINFNGEVYNFAEIRTELSENFGASFNTAGDAEAVVAAYHYLGADSVKRLRGMFAFMIWDSANKVVFGARDPFGIKPLFYTSGPGGTAFSSEKKSLLDLAPELGIAEDLNFAAVQRYLTFQYVPEPDSMHTAIQRIESGTYFWVRPGEDISVKRYFYPSFSGNSATDTGEALYKRIADVVRESVAKHMISDPDISVGSFLSGGIDSSATVCLAKEQNPNLIAFTTGFRREGYSEVDVAAETADAIGVKHVVRTVSAEDMMEALPLIVWYLDDPVADPALVPLWFIAREARKFVKAVLSGEGADELFGGYAIYREPLSLAPFEKVPGGVRKVMLRMSSRIPEGVKGKDLLRRGALSLEERYYGNARNFSSEQLQELIRGDIGNASFMDVTNPVYEQSRGWDAVSRMQHVDLFTWLRGDILVKADKVTMANSLELRVPFLDSEVFKVASEIPVQERLSHGTTKYALRKALEKVVPPHVLSRPKLGFPVPIRVWLRGEMYDWASGIIADSKTDYLIDKSVAIRMLEEHKDGLADRSRQVWSLLVFMIWHAIFVERRIKPVVPDPISPIR